MIINDFTSDEEWFFYLYLEELLKHNIITSIKYQPKPFVLFNSINTTYQKQLKTKSKNIKINFLQNHQYQADFLFYWNPNVHKILFADHTDILNQSIKIFPFIANYSKTKDQYYSVVDVKGTFNQNDAWRRFSIDQKWTFQNYGIYIQKIITHPQITKTGKMIPASALFPNTFVPKRFLLTTKSLKKRKINYSYILIDQYLKNLNLHKNIQKLFSF